MGALFIKHSKGQNENNNYYHLLCDFLYMGKLPSEETEKQIIGLTALSGQYLRTKKRRYSEESSHNKKRGKK